MYIKTYEAAYWVRAMHVFNKNIRNGTLDKINGPLALFSVSKSGLKKNWRV